MEKIPGNRFWADKIISRSSEARKIIAELEKIGASNVRYDSLDDQMFLGNIPSDKKRQLAKYLNSIGCTNIKIE